MKSISASIVVLSGAVMLSAGAFVRHSDSSEFLQFTGAIVGLVGLYGWFTSLKEPRQ